MIGPVIVAALPLLRASAESLMTSTCTIDRLTTTWDEEAQETTSTWEAVHEGIPCHLETASASLAVVTAEAATLETPILRVPYTVDDIEPDDRITVTGQPEPLWATRAAPEDATHPVEVLVLCRWVR